MKILLDTNICIYLLKNNYPKVRAHFDQYRAGEVGVSSITVAELWFGVEKSRQRERSSEILGEFLSPLEVVSFDSAAASCYGQVRADLERQGKTIGPLDMLIAAHALSSNLTLVTNNLREFSRVSGLYCTNWI